MVVFGGFRWLFLVVLFLLRAYLSEPEKKRTEKREETHAQKLAAAVRLLKKTPKSPPPPQKKDIDTLARRVRGLMGAPERDSDPAMHASYVLLSNDNAPPAGVPPPQPNIASFPPRRFPRTRQRPQAQIDGEAASKAKAQQAVAYMQTMMAAAVEAARKREWKERSSEKGERASHFFPIADVPAPIPL